MGRRHQWKATAKGRRGCWWIKEKPILAEIEKRLSDVWGSKISVSIHQGEAEHPHIQRLLIEDAPPGYPKKAVLKRWRTDGEEKYDQDISSQQLITEWASLDFLSQVFGFESPAPKVLTGDQTSGYFIMEEIPENTSLLQSLNGDDPDLAVTDLIQFAALMGKLHGRTLEQEEAFQSVQKQLGFTELPQPDYNQYFQRSITTLERLHVHLTPTASDDIQRVVEILSHPCAFSAFTHGDFVFQNCIAWQGELYLVDFENARFRHALWEGVTIRMLFPSMALNTVYRLPDPVRQAAENKYRHVLSQYLPAASDNDLYEKAFTAACAGWVLALCQGNLSLETALTSDAPWVNFLRQRILARIDLFVDTSREYGYFTGLGDFFGSLSADLKSQWPVGSQTLAYYPAFSRSE